MSEVKCYACRFFDPYVNNDSYGWCHRYPPSAPPEPDMMESGESDSLYNAAFPAVHGLEWCGEFQKADVPLSSVSIEGNEVDVSALGSRGRKVLQRLGYLVRKLDAATGKPRYSTGLDSPLESITYGELIECRNCGVVTAEEIVGWLAASGYAPAPKP